MSEINRLHDEAMDFAAFAFRERARGNAEKAHEFFERALEYEVAAIDALGEEYIEPTYSVLHRSAATLALDCKRYRKAEQLAAKALAQEPPGEIAVELRDVLKRAALKRGYLDYPASQPARLTFDGKPVVGQYGVAAGFSAKALAAFEKAVASVGASQDGYRGWMGRIPNRNAYNLLITGIAQGSFGFEFEGVSSGETNIPQRSKASTAVETVKRVLKASVETEDDHELADLLGDFNQRAIKDVYEFLEIVAKNEAVCALESGEDEIRFRDTEQVRRSAERLSRIESEEVVELIGQFKGFLPYRSRIEFLVDETRELINVTARRQIVEFAERNLNRPVIVTARRRQIGTARPHYTFLDIREW